MNPPAASASPVAMLHDLADASEALGDALMRHDRPGLVAANGRTEALTALLAERADTLTPAERTALAAPELAPLYERIRTAARRNMVLIEQAWALDAATLRLLAGVGQAQAEGQLSPYRTPSRAGYIDRQA